MHLNYISEQQSKVTFIHHVQNQNLQIQITDLLWYCFIFTDNWRSSLIELIHKTKATLTSVKVCAHVTHSIHIRFHWEPAPHPSSLHLTLSQPPAHSFVLTMKQLGLTHKSLCPFACRSFRCSDAPDLWSVWAASDPTEKTYNDFITLNIHVCGVPTTANIT